MRPLLFLIGSVAGFLALARRYRRAPATNTIVRTIERGTPVMVGDGSFWVASPGIGDETAWERSDRELRSPAADARLLGAELLVNGTDVSVPDAADDAVITVVYNGNSTLTVSTPESADGRVSIVWAEPSGSGFGHGDGWAQSADRWTYDSPGAPGGRITRILVDGVVWYRAKDYDKGGKRAKCELRLTYLFGAVRV